MSSPTDLDEHTVPGARRFKSASDGPSTWHLISHAVLLRHATHEQLELFSRGEFSGQLRFRPGDGERFLRVRLGMLPDDGTDR